MTKHLGVEGFAALAERTVIDGHFLFFFEKAAAEPRCKD